ncbi:MAG: folylpolyglutamate synthase/dihydrofolate synthase family protein [Bryobacteraceae bacterium]|jgi:dihydrofolate synthase/folylpolyglutamate synthase
MPALARGGLSLAPLAAEPGASGVDLSISYPDSVQFLYALGNEFKTIKFGLDRIRTLLAGLGNPQNACRFVHVAGTNGKGSTCAMIERSLRIAGVRTGLFVSPHLVEPTERIRVAGEPVTAAEFAAAFDLVHAMAERLVAAGEIDMHPTYFETIAAMAFSLFREKRADIVVLETGMGGRLDATNVVDPLLSVITPIDFDHEKYLGSSIPQIAFEKAGILKPGRPAVFARQRPEALEVLERRAVETGSAVTRVSDWEVRDLLLGARGNRFTAVNGAAEIEVNCPLIGEHQVDNAMTAVAALHVLDVPPKAIEAGLAATQWPGRLERVHSGPDVYLDGAHNPAGAAALAAYIRRFHGGSRVWMIFGAMRDKDLRVIGAELFPLAQELIFTTPNQTRAYRAQEIREISGETRARVVDAPAEALRLALQAPAEDVVFITGSLYLVGEIRGLPGLMG